MGIFTQRFHHIIACLIGFTTACAIGDAAAAGKTSRAPDISPAVAYVSVATGKLHAVTVTQANLNHLIWHFWH